MPSSPDLRRQASSFFQRYPYVTFREVTHWNTDNQAFYTANEARINRLRHVPKHHLSEDETNLLARADYAELSLALLRLEAWQDNDIPHLPTLLTMLPSSVAEKTRTLAVLWLQEELIHAFVWERNPLNVLVKLSGISDTPIGFAACILMLFKKPVTVKAIQDSGLLDSFFLQHADEPDLIKEAYALLRAVGVDEAFLEVTSRYTGALYRLNARGEYELHAPLGSGHIALNGQASSALLPFYNRTGLEFSLTVDYRNFRQLHPIYGEEWILFCLSQAGIESEYQGALGEYVGSWIAKLPAQALLKVFERIITAMPEEERIPALTEASRWVSPTSGDDLLGKGKQWTWFILAGQPGLL